MPTDERTDTEKGLNSQGLLDYQDSDEPVEDERPENSNLLADRDDADFD